MFFIFRMNSSDKALLMSQGVMTVVAPEATDPNTQQLVKVLIDGYSILYGFDHSKVKLMSEWAVRAHDTIMLTYPSSPHGMEIVQAIRTLFKIFGFDQW